MLAGCGHFKGERGADGTTVVGPQGTQGAPGVQGPAGPSGLDGSSVETIALCPGIQSNGFAEYLLRIDNSLYGVYAQGQKIYLTLLAPGDYETNDGRHCQYTVNEDGSITE